VASRDERSIIVTGAGKGLGRAIVEQLLGEHASVIAIDKDQRLLDGLRNEFSTGLRYHCLDVCDYRAVGDFFRALATTPFGLVNNAGIHLGKDLVDYSPEEIARVIDVNLKGAIFCSQFFGRLLLPQSREGAIVNLSSSAIYGGSDVVYSATKAGLIGLTKSCALKFAPHIRVNAVAPGIVTTDMLATIPDDVVRRYRTSELINKPLEPADVANTVSFLLSDAARNYTGAVFDLNNGFHM